MYHRQNQQCVILVLMFCNIVCIVNGAYYRRDCVGETSSKCSPYNSYHTEKRGDNSNNDRESPAPTEEKSNGQPSENEQPVGLQKIQNTQGNNDRLDELLDLNSEPAVEDLMRQIMSQAKLWEAIQEANREMVIQKAVQHSKDHFPLAFSAQ